MRRFAALLVVAGLALAPTPAVGADEATYTLRQQGPDTVPTLSLVTETLTATSAEGDPVPGLTVRFERSGPGDEAGDSCPADDLTACAETDASGKAHYDFLGGSFGTATVSALVYDAAGELLTTVTDTVTFAPMCRATARTSCPPLGARLSGRSQGARDVLKVDAPARSDGARVRLQRKGAKGWNQVGRAATVNRLGDHTFRVLDRNGDGKTRYRALVSGTVDTRPDVTNQVRVR
jgi:hypothetical protein